MDVARLRKINETIVKNRIKAQHRRTQAIINKGMQQQMEIQSRLSYERTQEDKRMLLQQKKIQKQKEKQTQKLSEEELKIQNCNLKIGMLVQKVCGARISKVGKITNYKLNGKRLDIEVDYEGKRFFEKEDGLIKFEQKSADKSIYVKRPKYKNTTNITQPNLLPKPHTLLPVPLKLPAPMSVPISPLVDFEDKYECGDTITILYKRYVCDTLHKRLGFLKFIHKTFKMDNTGKLVRDNSYKYKPVQIHPQIVTFLSQNSIQMSDFRDHFIWLPTQHLIPQSHHIDDFLNFVVHGKDPFFSI